MYQITRVKRKSYILFLYNCAFEFRFILTCSFQYDFMVKALSFLLGDVYLTSLEGVSSVAGNLSFSDTSQLHGKMTSCIVFVLFFNERRCW